MQLYAFLSVASTWVTNRVMNSLQTSILHVVYFSFTTPRVGKSDIPPSSRGCAILRIETVLSAHEEIDCMHAGFQSYHGLACVLGEAQLHFTKVQEALASFASFFNYNKETAAKTKNGCT